MGDRSEERIHRAEGGSIQVQRGSRNEFTRAKRQVFLNTLAATCNTTMAVAAAGISKTTANKLRRTSPEFAALWEEAMEIGYRHLEEELLSRAIEGIAAMTIDPDAAPVKPLPPIAAPAAASAGDMASEDRASEDRASEDRAPADISGRPGQDGIAHDAQVRQGAVGLAAVAGAGVLSGRGLPVAYQLALLILSQRRAARANGQRNLRRKAMTTQEVDALLTRKLDRLDQVSRRKADRASVTAKRSEPEA